VTIKFRNSTSNEESNEIDFVYTTIGIPVPTVVSPNTASPILKEEIIITGDNFKGD